MELVDLLAQNYFGNTRSGSLAGPVGGFIIAVLAVATVLLIRNMNGRLRRLPDRFPQDGPPPPDEPASSRSGAPGAAPPEPPPGAAHTAGEGQEQRR